jgi:ribonuclease I
MNDDEVVNKIMSSSQYPTEPFSRGNSVGTGRGSFTSGGGMSLQTVDYLAIPDNDLMIDEEDQINYQRQLSSKQWNRIVGFGVVIALVGAVVVAIVFYKEQQHSHSSHHPAADDDHLPLATCYQNPTCRDYTAYSPAVYNPQGFTNLTGWQDVMSYDGCCNICLSIAPTVQPSLSPTIQPTSAGETGNPTQAPTPSPTQNPSGNPSYLYDYLLLDLMWLPQFCHALNEGHDFTLSHTLGSHCQSAIYSTQPRLSIHGLWPNKVNGSLACCTSASSNYEVKTLDPVQVSSWPIWSGMEFYWFDPTISTSSQIDGNTCSVCYLLNHEWQKHGSCFTTASVSDTFRPAFESESDSEGREAQKTTSFKVSSKSTERQLRTTDSERFPKDADSDEFQYFEVGLLMRDVIGDEIDAVSAYAGQITTAEELRALFPTARVNIICDPQDSYLNIHQDQDVEGERGRGRVASAGAGGVGVQVLSEIQTCWYPTITKTGDTYYQMIDCPKAYESRFTTACTGSVYVRTFTNKANVRSTVSKERR